MPMRLIHWNKGRFCSSILFPRLRGAEVFEGCCNVACSGSSEVYTFLFRGGLCTSKFQRNLSRTVVNTMDGKIDSFCLPKLAIGLVIKVSEDSGFEIDRVQRLVQGWYSLLLHGGLKERCMTKVWSLIERDPRSAQDTFLYSPMNAFASFLSSSFIAFLLVFLMFGSLFFRFSAPVED